MRQVSELEKVAAQLRRAEAGWLHQSRVKLRRAAAERRLANRKRGVR